jgi:hypothetical protein
MQAQAVAPRVTLAIHSTWEGTSDCTVSDDFGTKLTSNQSFELSERPSSHKRPQTAHATATATGSRVSSTTGTAGGRAGPTRNNTTGAGQGSVPSRSPQAVSATTAVWTSSSFGLASLTQKSNLESESGP